MNQEVKQYYDRLLIHFKLMNLGERTILIYKGIASQFLSNLTCDPLNITQEQLELFVLEKNASRSKEQALTVLKHLYRNIFKQPEKVNHIPIPKHDEYLPDILTPQEVFLICNHPTNIKHRAVLTLIYSCALRISEATNIKFEHIDSQRRSLKVKCGKGRKDRLIPLPVETINLLRQYCAEWKPHNRGHYLFGGQKVGEPYSTRSIQTKFNEAVISLKINKDVSVHTLRHSRATHWLDNGIDIRKIQVALGHKRVTTTEIYTHTSIQSMINVFDIADEKIKNETLLIGSNKKQHYAIQHTI